MGKQKKDLARWQKAGNNIPTRDIVKDLGKIVVIFTYKLLMRKTKYTGQ